MQQRGFRVEDFGLIRQRFSGLRLWVYYLQDLVTVGFGLGHWGLGRMVQGSGVVLHRQGFS